MIEPFRVRLGEVDTSVPRAQFQNVPNGGGHPQPHSKTFNAVPARDSADPCGPRAGGEFDPDRAFFLDAEQNEVDRLAILVHATLPRRKSAASPQFQTFS